MSTTKRASTKKRTSSKPVVVLSGEMTARQIVDEVKRLLNEEISGWTNAACIAVLSEVKDEVDGLLQSFGVEID